MTCATTDAYNDSMLRKVNRVDRAREHQSEVSGHRRRVPAVQDAGERVQPIVVRLRLCITSRTHLVMASLCADERTLAFDLSIAIHPQGPLELVPRIGQPELPVLLVIEQSLLAARCHLRRKVSPDIRNEGDSYLGSPGRAPTSSAAPTTG